MGVAGLPSQALIRGRMSGTSRPEMMVIRLLGDVGGVRVGGPTSTSINPAEKSIPTIYMEKNRSDHRQRRQRP